MRAFNIKDFKLPEYTHHDWLLSFLLFMLSLIGLIAVFTSTYDYTVNRPSQLFYKHIVFLLIGTTSYIVLSTFDFKWLKETKILLLCYFAILGLLIYVKFAGNTIADTNRWIVIGPLNFQPAEAAKLIIVLVVSKVMSWNRHVNKMSHAFGSNKLNLGFQLSSSIPSFHETLSYITKAVISFFITLPILLLILVQPSLGNAVVCCLIWLGMFTLNFPDHFTLIQMALLSILGFCFIGIITNFFNPTMGLVVFIILVFISYLIISKRHAVIPKLLLIAFTSGIVLMGIVGTGWNHILKPYQKERIIAFINPQADPQGAGWQTRQAQIAIGSGMITGKGVLKGTQTALGLLPFAHTDFAFASLAEQFGFIGSISISFLLFAICMKLFAIAKSFKDIHTSLLVCGIACMLMAHVSLHLLINLGTLPVSGIPLPLVSYGGSTILITLLSMGIVQNMVKTNV